MLLLLFFGLKIFILKTLPILHCSRSFYWLFVKKQVSSQDNTTPKWNTSLKSGKLKKIKAWVLFSFTKKLGSGPSFED